MENDRSNGLILFGALQILVGLACGALLLAAVASAVPTPSMIFLTGVAAFFFVAAGVGSIKARRWSRALSTVVSALWLAGGVIALLTTLLIVPRVIKGAQIGLIAAGIAGLAIVLPAILFFFYRRDDVRATCDRRDKPRWTDAVPLPVLALAVVMAFASLWLLVRMSDPVVPLFGTVVTGGPAALTLLALSILCGILAVQSYRLKESAWWTVVLLQVVGCVIWAASMVRDGGRDPVVWAVSIATWIGYFAFLMMLRKYFVGGRRGRPRVVEVEAT
ncbi:MAG TPA: hypothetical protein VGF69_13070 [Thermoanaerobaculia bacterium]|jgi:hypothetical protein